MRLIDADALENSIPELDAWEEEEFGTDGMRTLIYEAPTIEPERPTGHWISEVKGKKAIIDEFGIVSCSAHCSECGDWLTASDEYGCRGRFCPNCGAKMGDEHDDS